DRRAHHATRTQARHPSRCEFTHGRRPRDVEAVAGRSRHDGLDRSTEFLGRLSMTDLPKPDYARNMRIIGHSDQGGRPDGVQVMVHRGYAYIGHMFSKGFSVVDVRDAKNPRAVNYLAAPLGTWNINLQIHDDLLLVINAKDMFAAAEFADEKAITKASSARWWARLRRKIPRATGPLGSRSMTSPRRRPRGASASCRLTAAASTASGTPADRR